MSILSRENKRRRIDMQIIYLDINKIIPYNKNPRINKEAIKYVASSIREFGFKVPITIDENYVIITGHTRYEASKLLKLKKIPCIIVKDLDKDKIKAYRLADNKVSELARWDYNKLEEELKNIKDIKMEVYGFLNKEDMMIDWDNIEEIDIDNYEKPDEKKCQCPYCKHEDSRMRFKKVKL